MFRVRKVSRKLSKKSQILIENLLPKVSFNQQEFSFYNRVHLEIGFGTGDHILKQALLNPSDLFIGCEPYMNGVASLLLNIEKYNVSNILIHNDDAIKLLNIFDDNLLINIYVLFPDPWPKVKHHKRRLINKSTLQLFYDKLKPEGGIIIATDDENYKNAIDQSIIEANLFYKIDNHLEVETKYSKQARCINAKINYFNLKKIK